MKYIKTVSTFNPPLAGMVVETSQPIELFLEPGDFQPTLAGMVVETRPV
ncbi:hypothetical protein [Nostoc commune]|nr:hypothetical protein [Nostoc commune]